MDAQKEVERILTEEGAILIRRTHHNVYQLPDGSRWVTPCSASDCHSWANNLSALKRRLGLQKQLKEIRERRLYKPFVEHKKEFLGEITGETEPLSAMSDQLFTMALEAIGQIPKKKPYRRKPEHITRPVKSLPSDVILQANEILKNQGADAVAKFLNTRRTNA